MANPFSLEDKTILVTGASSGIGRTTAIVCSQMGAKVVVTGRNRQRLEDTFNALEGDGHMMFVADLRQDDQLDLLIEQMPTIDGLVNNAGVTEPCLTPFIKRDKLESVLGINTIAPILLTQRVVRKKKIGKGGSIVFTCSISGTSVSSGGNVLYSTSKGAIHSFMANAAFDLASKGIRVNEVCPGMIETPILDNSTIDKEMLQQDMLRYPMKRYGRSEEVAYGIVYLLSDASSFCTGTSLKMDGGFSLY